jgi:hypothetical protein
MPRAPRPGTIDFEELELPFPTESVPATTCGLDRSPLAPFADCPLCGGDLAPEHAHYRCGACGWRDSCCD